MPKNTPANELPVEIVDPRYFYENDVTEEVVDALLKNFPEYCAALDQSGVALDDLILLSRHPGDDEDYCLYRYFAAERGPRGFILVLVADKHLEQAILLAEAKEMLDDLPPPPKKKKKGDGGL